MKKVQMTLEQESILVKSRPATKLQDLVLPMEQLEVLSRFVEEHRNRTMLKKHGLCPSRKLLIVGPPGTGKTFTASALAGELNLSLFRVPLDAVITGIMGATAAKLRIVFDAVRDVPGVYLLDEFDALAPHRRDDQESNRIVSSLLEFMEEAPMSSGIVVATTNLADALDRAIFRRFDVHLEYDLPDVTLLQDLITKSIPSKVPDEVLPYFAQQAIGLSCSDVVEACLSARNSAVLMSVSNPNASNHLLEAIAKRKRFKRSMDVSLSLSRN